MLSIPSALAPLCCCSTEISQKINFRLFTVDNKLPDEEEPGQDHVFTFWKQLTRAQKDELDQDFDELQHEFGMNLELLKEDFIQAQRNEFLRKTSSSVTLARPRVMDWELKRPPGLEHGANLTQLANVPAKRQQIWCNAGFDLYSKGRVAIVVMSGGLDSRLGEDVPKGTLDFGLISGKSIFQLYAERIDRLQNLVAKKLQREAERQKDREETKMSQVGQDRKSGRQSGRQSARDETSRPSARDNWEEYQVHIPLYIMCNKANIAFISAFWEENNHFGLRQRDVMLFQQMDYPSIDHNGKLLLGEKHKIIQSPCGNGGFFRAVIEEGMYADMKTRGVSCMYVCSIDNILTKVGDPMFVGYCDNCFAECGVKCITKIGIEENLGCYVSKMVKSYKDLDGDGKKDLVVTVKPAVYEFFEMDEELRNQKARNDPHNFTFNAGNLSQYVFKLDFVRRVCPKMERTWHMIHKRFSHIDLRSGRKIETSDPNGYRMEQWIFDSFHYSAHVAGLLVPREEYAVIKQRVGLQSPGSASRTLSLLHQSWILKAGGTFIGDKTASEQHDQKCEVSPLVSYDGENLGGHFLVPLSLPYYLPSKVEDSDTVAVQALAIERLSMHFVHDKSPMEAMERDREMNSARETQAENSARGYRGERAVDRDEQLPPTPPDAPGRRNSLRRGSLGLGDSPLGQRRNSLVGGDSPLGQRRNSLVGGDSPLGQRRNSLVGGDSPLGQCRNSLVGGDSPLSPQRRNSLAGGDSPLSPLSPQRRNSLAGGDSFFADMDDYDYDGENDLSTCRTGRSSRRSARFGGMSHRPVVRTSSRDHSARRLGEDEDPWDTGIQRHKSIDKIMPQHKDLDDPHHVQVELFDWEKIQEQREERAGDESARVSILSGWSHQSVQGEIFEEMEHAFGHIVGTTGVRNTGKGTRVYNAREKFWTPGEHVLGDNDSDMDYWLATAR